MKCPNCQANLSIAAIVPEEQTVYVKLTSEAESFSAQTIGGIITETDRLLKLAAKEVGASVHVFISSVEQNPHEITIGLLITSIKSSDVEKVTAEYATENPTTQDKRL